MLYLFFLQMNYLNFNLTELHRNKKSHQFWSCSKMKLNLRVHHISLHTHIWQSQMPNPAHFISTCQMKGSRINSEKHVQRGQTDLDFSLSSVLVVLWYLYTISVQQTTAIYLPATASGSSTHSFHISAPVTLFTLELHYRILSVLQSLIRVLPSPYHPLSHPVVLLTSLTMKSRPDQC